MSEHPPLPIEHLATREVAEQIEALPMDCIEPGRVEAYIVF